MPGSGVSASSIPTNGKYTHAPIHYGPACAATPFPQRADQLGTEACVSVVHDLLRDIASSSFGETWAALNTTQGRAHAAWQAGSVRGEQGWAARGPGPSLGGVMGRADVWLL